MFTVLDSDLLSLMPIVVRFTLAVQVYSPALKVLRLLNIRVSVLLICTAMLFKSESLLLLLTAFLVHTMSGVTIKPSTTSTLHVILKGDPSDVLPVDVIITLGEGRAVKTDNQVKFFKMLHLHWNFLIVKNQTCPTTK